jgi:hypothetical protein
MFHFQIVVSSREVNIDVISVYAIKPFVQFLLAINPETDAIIGKDVKTVRAAFKVHPSLEAAAEPISG